jgi:Organic solute transporter Ostalpha
MMMMVDSNSPIVAAPTEFDDGSSGSCCSTKQQLQQHLQQQDEEDAHPMQPITSNSSNRSNGSSSSSIGGICSSLFCCSSGNGPATMTSTAASCFTCTTLHLCCHTVLLIGLGVIITLMGIQLHAVEQQLAIDETDIATLKEQVANQHQNQQDLNQRVEQEHSLTLYQMAGTFTLLTCLITAFHITQHLSNFNEAVVQRKIVAILWMSPIYSITSFLSLVFPSADEYLAVLKDCYEAYTVYTFLSFLIAVLGRGDRDAAIQVLACHADHLQPPAACLRSFYFPSPETSASAMASAVLTECQILAMQFVLVRPITSLLSFIADTVAEHQGSENGDDDGSPYAYFKSPNFYIAMITNISVFFAFNGLLKFYHAVREDLKWCQPFNKFLSIKSIVFLTFWQGLLISIIVNVNYNNDSMASTPISQTIPPAATPPALSPTVLSPHYFTPDTLQTTAPAPTISSSVSNSEPSFHDENSDGMDPTKPHNNSTRYHRHLRILGDPTITTSSSSDTSTGHEGGSNDGGSSSSSGSGTSNGNENTQNGKDDEPMNSHERAAQIQNFLICLEMLFFSIAHWCVFPAEEWKPDYRPQQHYAKPGIGLKDFAKDIGYIVRSSTSARRAAYHKHTNRTTTDSSNNAHSTYKNGSDDGEYFDDIGTTSQHNPIGIDDSIVEVRLADADVASDDDCDDDILDLPQHRTIT